MELARDMRDEYHHVLEELHLMNLPVMTLQTRKQLFLLKQKVAVLLLAKVRMNKRWMINRNAKLRMVRLSFPANLSSDGLQ